MLDQESTSEISRFLYGIWCSSQQFECVGSLQIFNFNQKPSEEEQDEDLSDSEDSVYSGLEDSGSDSEGDDNEEEEDERGSDDDDDDDEEDGLKVEPKQTEQVEFCVCVRACVRV